MRKTLLLISLFMIIVSITFGDDDLSMKEPSPNKDAYMLSLPTAYIMPKGQMRIQMTYNFNPFQTYFDLHDDYYDNVFSYYPDLSYHDLKHDHVYGIIFDYSIFKFMQLSISYSKSIWSKALFYRDEYYYDDYINKMEIIGTVLKLRLFKERKFFPQISIYNKFSLLNESIRAKSKKGYYLIYNDYKEKRKSSSEFDFIPLIITKHIALEKNVYLTLCFSTPIFRRLLIFHDTYGGVFLNLYNRFKFGYENRMSYLRYYKSYGKSEVLFRRSSVTKFYFAYKVNKVLNIQL
ncbi:hypothetical protein KAU33_07610 [Candidatus Dependentiae bacterium]|nr:hypothetical protein [Candidatus Dependentiae bacterium]